MTRLYSTIPFCLALFWLPLFALSAQAQNPDHQQRRSEAQQHLAEGNYHLAYKAFRALALDPADEPREAVGQDLQNAIACLQRLNRLDEVDDFREGVIDMHQENRWLLRDAARSYLGVDHFGYLIGGEFVRGPHRGGGQRASSFRRDRVRALQLYQQALQHSHDADPRDRAQLHLDFAQAFLHQDPAWDVLWRLQILTSLDTLPEVDEIQHYYRHPQRRGTPAHSDGTPVYHERPASWQSAASDGERWRWLLKQASELDPRRTNEALVQQAQLYQRLYGVQTLLADSHWARSLIARTETGDDSLYSVRHLAEDESMARLASGVARFKLPDEFNHLRLYQRLLDAKPVTAHQALATIYENRQQYPRAAHHLRKMVGLVPKPKPYRQRLEAIVGNWGRFEPDAPQAAGATGELFYRFRNAHALDLQIYRIDVERLLRDLKEYIRSSPRNLDYHKLNLNQIGYRLVVENEQQYLVERVASWTESLQPLAEHFDTRVRIQTPVTRAGAYLVIGRLADGNTSRIVMWLNDTVLLRKHMHKQLLYYAADAHDGSPADKLRLSFFGFKRTAADLPAPLKGLFYKTRIEQFERQTDSEGMVVVDETQQANEYQWLVMAQNDEGRLAVLGLERVWFRHYPQEHYQSRKYFGITDRPVYRPAHTVNLKVWAQQVSYTRAQTALYANQTVRLRVIDAKDNIVYEKDLRTNQYGGIDTSFTLAEDASLGSYRYGFARGKTGLSQAGTFRVEEYKKPEFEVKLSVPDQAVKLGERVDIELQARYYFGEAVTQGRVNYRILRHTQNEPWYPASQWDWLYGRGHGWQAYDYDWYPGWNQWGCRSPIPPWLPAVSEPPQLVAENEVPLETDGRIIITLDTRLAKQLHGDTDHRYEIIAEVTDASRRTIVARDSVTVAREAFQVRAWVDKGYYHSGDPVTAYFKALTANQQPVSGKGRLRLFKVNYDAKGQPVERLLKRWSLHTDSQGHAEQRYVAGGPGQYRLAFTVTDREGHQQEGAYIYNVIGENISAQSFRFNPVELISAHSRYRPGQQASLLLNTRGDDRTVLLFLRPRNGVYKPPRLLRLAGKSRELQLLIENHDMPNFFIEALTIADGKIYTTVKEIAVPPRERSLDIEILSDKPRYRPGEQAKLKVRVTDAEGQPVQGDTVLTVYDKAVEYIAGGSNVAAIRPFFWQWRRQHQPQETSNLQRHFVNLLRRGEPPMQSIGVLGNLLGETRDVPSELMADAAVRSGAVAESVAAAPAARQLKKSEPDSTRSNAEQTDYVEPQLRKRFTDTAMWSAHVELDEQGIGELEFSLPEDLTTWQIRAWSLAHGTRVGQAEHRIETFKNLLLRMQAPRFFVEKDEVVLSANIHNYLDSAQDIRAVLELEDDTLSPLDAKTKSIRVAQGGEVRVDWRVKVTAEGEAIVRMKALGTEESDAVQMQFPVYVHGGEKFESVTGSLKARQNSETFSIEVPAARRVPSTVFTLQFSPSLATAMVDALPYLVDYPYGCTEQTLSRFLPTVITRNTLHKMGIDLKAVAEKRNNLNAQELGDPVQRAGQWQSTARNPVFDDREVERMAQHGLQRLLAMQVNDGGWGWFSGQGERSYPHTTAYVMHGLYLARHNGLVVPAQPYQDGLQWLERYLHERVETIRASEADKDTPRRHAENTDALIYMVLAQNERDNQAMRDLLYRDRNRLSVYAKAMFALALDPQAHPEMVNMLRDNIEQYLVMDSENETAYLNLPNAGYWWYWYGSETEAHAYYLKLLAKLDPHSKKAAWLVKYLVNNRKHASYWNSTRDTAIAIEAFADYLAATDQLQPELKVQVYVDGKPYTRVNITRENLFSFNNRVELRGEALRAGQHRIRIDKQGEGPLFYNAYLSYFSLEDPIAAAGLEIKVERRYYRLQPVTGQRHSVGQHGQALVEDVVKYERIALKNLDDIESGEKVEVELIIDSKNDYEYLVFEDFKAAGFEPLSVRSGYTDNELGAYVEYRDERVSFFVRQLARGQHSISYRMRAEVPGQFSALPAQAHAMYAPELRGNSAEIKLRVTDRATVAP